MTYLTFAKMLYFFVTCLQIRTRHQKAEEQSFSRKTNLHEKKDNTNRQTQLPNTAGVTKILHATVITSAEQVQVKLK